ncbi:MAG: membrane-bound PQQ-dependent dehydrogenase, glucose/quinate/shikimate family [Pseudotabrizicola sp.]|uniref:membrane-bound PQQ-dependent dehydrogenase, glucose/quinate/shikimate family n=1 Tax=Pseudotabrizicola sp. TaxID=2939647 RepID=UPI002721A372|nr:membrane-bound PQQ-dependent dehydrogenase, glucose/quinate/shikimate family [Pseudotabrizicola sp.]MDO9639907.1 membrane-bound PQQ-dependent dehydrogenase, glucose/quinate/shikimate family [Pseudotabrizicola sp.]
MRHPSPVLPRRNRAASIAVTVLAVVLVIFGLPIFAGGIWLITLGGSWYYAFAGAGLLATAYGLFNRTMAAVWLYLLTFVGTVIWAFWEAGFNWWAQVPRLVAPTVILLLVLAAIPALRRLGSPQQRGVLSVAALLGAMAALGGPSGHIAQAQDTAPTPVTPDAPTAPEPAAPEPETPADQTAASEPAGAEPINFAMPEAGADWPAYGGTHHATRYSPLDQITPQNVTELRRVWEFRTGDMPEEDHRYSNQNTPLKIGDQVLICSAMNKVIALDARTGLENWRYDPQVPTDAIPYNATCRGLAYYASPTLAAEEPCAERVIMNTLDARLIAVDTRTGLLCEGFGTGGTVNLEEGIGHTVPGWYAPTSPPTIVRNIAVVHSQVRDGQRRDAPSGVIRGYDAETGEMAWAWDMGRPGETGLPPEGETYTRGTPNVWTIASGDNDLGLVYLPHGVPSVDYWGGMRSDIENEYSTALVALDVETGQVAWHYQTVHYDVWDYDLGSQGTLIDFPTPDGPVPALILPTKLGMFFIFNRETGELLVEVEERPVPQGGVEPERLSPTQPFVVDFPSTLKPDLEERHMWGMTPLDQLWCRIQYRRANYDGIYTPPSADRDWIQYPGYNGGSDWGGVAIDPVRGIMVANYNDTPNFNRLLPREEADGRGAIPIDEPGAENNPDGINPQADTPFAIKVNAGWRVPLTGLLCKEPPYGGIMAIDLATRQVLWDKPFGTARKNGPFGIPSMLPLDIGTPNNAGSVVTASGLIFIAAATDDLIRAMDIETGEVLWQDALPAGGQAGPAMYEVDGVQYLIINAGGHNFMETPIGDYFIAYALP